MRLKAIGRHLLVRMDTESISNKTSGGIYLPEEHINKEKGGCQVATVLDVGECAFDDQPEVHGTIQAGNKVVTSRYPGSALDLDQNWSDEKANQYRVILDNEVRCMVDDGGVDIE